MPDVKPDIREVYEMVTKQKPSDPGALERQRTRQIRALRNRKIGAIAMTTAMAIAVAVLLVANGPEQDGRGTANEPSQTPAVRVARGFFDAYAAFDADGVMTYLADDADVAALVTSLGDEGLEGTTEELPLFFSMLDAMSFEQHYARCAESGGSGSHTPVRCTFGIHLLGSQAFGRDPFTGSYVDLTVRDGEVVEAAVHWETERFSSAMWEPFAEWVSTNHPEDAAVMYEDETYGAVHVTEESVVLWEQRVRDYVDEIGSIRGAPVGRLSVVVDGVPVSLRVPSDGWGRFGAISINKSIVGPQGAEAMIFWTTFPDGSNATPCSRVLDSAVGTTSADLAAAVAAAPGTGLVVGPSDVTVGGLPAKHVVLTVREDVGCDPGYFYTWPDVRWGALWPDTRVGDTIRVWIVDVGGTRLFIEAETNDQAGPDLEREVQQIIGSIRFE